MALRLFVHIQLDSIKQTLGLFLIVFIYVFYVSKNCQMFKSGISIFHEVQLLNESVMKKVL